MDRGDIGPIGQVLQFLQATEHYSYSSIQTFKDCPRMFFNSRERMLDDATGGKVKMHFGSALHSGLEHLFRHGDVEGALDATIRTYTLLINPDIDYIPTGYSLEAAMSIIVGYARKWSPDPYVAVDGMVEVGIIARIEDFYYVARLDAVVQPTGQRMLPFEHKSTTSITDWWIKSFNPNDQITSYIASLNLAVGPHNAQLSAVVDCLAVNPPVGRDAYMRMPLARTQADLDEWRRETIAWVRKIREARDRGEWLRNTRQCAGCAFRTLCTFNDNPAILATFPRRQPKNFV